MLVAVLLDRFGRREAAASAPAFPPTLSNARSGAED
jgi:hypothetical protein